jgi:nucleotide-binding universal stress UspA family protein
MTWTDLLVAADGTAAALHALAVANELAARQGLRRSVVTVVRAAEPPPAALLDFDPVVLRGDPAIEIARHAERCGADLIVLGRRALRYGSEFALGSTAEAVVRRARVPCLLIPETQRDFAHVVVALDGTERGIGVLDAVREAGRLLNGAVELVTVEPPHLPLVPVVPTGRTLRLAEAVRERGTRQALPELLVRQGEPVSVLRQELCQPGSDLLVLGTRLGGSRHAPHSSGTGRALMHTVMSAILTVPL